jgi:hypothetical protein
MDRSPSQSSSDPEKHLANDTAKLARSDSPILVDHALEKRVWRKLDFYMLPVVAMFYLLSFLVSDISIFLRQSGRLNIEYSCTGSYEFRKCSRCGFAGGP